jgi:Flp pilus assembly protein TadD
LGRSNSEKIMSIQEGYRYYKEGDYQKAAEICEKILDTDENNPKVWNLLGICLTKLEQYDLADTCYQNSLVLDPDNKAYQKNIIINEKKTGQYSHYSFESNQSPGS